MLQLMYSLFQVYMNAVLFTVHDKDYQFIKTIQLNWGFYFLLHSKEYLNIGEDLLCWNKRNRTHVKVNNLKYCIVKKYSFLVFIWEKRFHLVI